MANLSFKQGDLSNISNNDTSNGAVYFSKDDTFGHSAHGYIFYDDEIDRIPINGSGYYMAPDKKNNTLKSMFIENNLFNSGAGAFIGVGHDNKDLLLHKSSIPENSDRGLWSPLWVGTEEDPIDWGTWILRVGKDPDSSTDLAEYLYLGSPKYRNETGGTDNSYTIRPAVKDFYQLGDSQYKWADIHTLNITSNTGTFSSKLTIIDKSDTENNTGIDCQGNKIIIAGDCVGSEEHPNLVIGDIGPQILFTRKLDQSESGNQKIALIYTTHDEVFTGNSITLATTETEAAFISPVLIAKNRVMTSNISNILRIVSLSNGDHFTPITDSLTFLGDNDHRWKKIYTLDIDANGNLSVQGTTTTSGLITANGGIVGNLTGNASTATKLKTARILKVGSDNAVSFDGSADVEIPLSVSLTQTGQTTAGPKLKVTVNGAGSSTITIHSASDTQSGVVTTSSQTFAGDKTFANNATYFKMASNDKWGSISPYNKAFPSSATAETANTLPGIILTAHSYGQTTPSTASGWKTEYWKTRGIDRVVLSSGTNAAFYPTSVNDSNSQVNRISLGCNLRRWKALYVKAIFTESDRLLPSVDYGIHLGDDDHHWNRVYAKTFIAHDKDIRPTTAGKINLGVSDSRWSNIWSVNGVNTGSDIRIKDVQDFNILDRLLKMYDSIKPIAYRLKNFNSNENHDRVHVGFSAQEIEEKMLENNLTRMDFGGLCVDPVYQKDEEGNDTSEIIDERYSLRYGEFHGLHTLKNQQQDARLTELENKNKELENIISTLKTQVELLKLAIGG